MLFNEQEIKWFQEFIKSHLREYGTLLLWTCDYNWNNIEDAKVAVTLLWYNWQHFYKNGQNRVMIAYPARHFETWKIFVSEFTVNNWEYLRDLIPRNSTIPSTQV